jgi:hypothetical protein
MCDIRQRLQQIQKTLVGEIRLEVDLKVDRQVASRNVLFATAQIWDPSSS